ncbi:hypothetical protein GALL_540710 [mine drainage metagenome]|uniref:Uncharacterized protein n=1 Tax=mine drainage metagenome TaxID=410659 RepID=A0A1J5P013_9ZZZZ
MNPAELFQLLAGLSKHAEHLALEAQLVDPSGPCVRTVKHLVRRRRDADRPGRARRKGAVGDHRLVGNLADRWPCIRRHRHVDGELAQEFSVLVEHLNPVVAAIGDVDVIVGIGRDRVRGIELTGFLAAIAPRLQPVAVLVHLRDARIDVAVADEGVAGLVPCHVGDLTKSSGLGGQRRLGML